MNKLDDIRQQIDRVDDEIIQLLNRRILLARGVAMVKNDQTNISYTDKSRECQVLERLKSMTNDVILAENIDDLYQRIFTVSKMVRHLAKETSLPFRKIGIIGDGLLGRSIFKTIALKKSNTIELIIKNRDWKIEDFAGCDLIVIATPIDTVNEIATTLATNDDKFQKTIIVDVASIKSSVTNQFRTLNDRCTNIKFIPTHPMGGRQEKGNWSAKATLFAGRPWVVCDDLVAIDALAKVIAFIQYCGGNPVMIEAQKHDLLVANISHVPGILSKSLLDFVHQYYPESVAIAGPAFEMMTAIGKTDNLRMRSQINANNMENIEYIMNEFITFLMANYKTIWNKYM